MLNFALYAMQSEYFCWCTYRCISIFLVVEVLQCNTQAAVFSNNATTKFCKIILI